MTTERIKVKLEKSEERALQYYLDYLIGLANKKSVEIFSNKGEAHASILMATLLANTEKSVSMYCQGLRPGILSGENDEDPKGWNGAYWAEFKKFFDKTIKSAAFGSNSVRLLIQSENWLKNQPFKIVAKSLQDNETKDKIKVKIIKPENRDMIENLLGKKNGKNINYNFSVFDNKAFRLEYDPDEYRAIGSFDDVAWCNLLNNLFEKAYKQADDITEKVRKQKIS